MGSHPDDVTAAGDFSLVEAARHGDRLAFGVLYLRHHAAAWRIACVASRFSPDAELAVIEGFTRLFSALPEEAEEFTTGAVTLRPYVLACVRQAALDRADAAGRPDRPGAPSPAPLAGLGPDGEVVLSSLEHHVARGALAALPERSRTALWLFDVEAMTPAEVAGILGGTTEEIAAVAGSARAEVRATQQAAFGRHEVRAGCRFTVEHLDGYRAAALEPADGLIVRSHLDRCPPCRMRHGELADAPATLAAAVPAAPLLGGEAQQHWLVSAPGLRPAERLLAPGLAAAGGAGQGPAHHIPDVLRRAGRAAVRSWRPAPEGIDLTRGGAAGVPDPAVDPAWTAALRWSGSLTPALPVAWTLPPVLAAATAPAGPGPTGSAPAGSGPTGFGPGDSGSDGGAGVLTVASGPAGSRLRRRALGPAVAAGSLVAAWLVTMLAVPWLMTPASRDGLALPAVQAYVNGLLPDAAPAPHRSRVAPEPFFPGGDPAADVPQAGVSADGRPVEALLAAAHSRPSAHGSVPHGAAATAAPLPAVPAPAVAAPAVVPVSVTVAPTLVASPPATPGPPLTGTGSAGPSARPGATARQRPPAHRTKPPKGTTQAAPPAVVPDRPGPTTDPTPARRSSRRPGRQPWITTA